MSAARPTWAGSTSSARGRASSRSPPARRSRPSPGFAAVKSLGSRRLDFNGFPSLRMAVVTAKGFHGSLRLVRADGRLYLLSVLRPHVAPTDDEEAEVLKRLVVPGPSEPERTCGRP